MANHPNPDGMYVRIVQGDHDLSLDSLNDEALMKAQSDKAMQAQSFSWCFGPLCISASIDLSAPSVSVTVTLAGITIAHLVIDPSNPKACIDADVKLASVKLCISVDFNAHNVSVNGEVCTFFTGCKSFDQVIFNW